MVNGWLVQKPPGKTGIRQSCSQQWLQQPGSCGISLLQAGSWEEEEGAGARPGPGSAGEFSINLLSLFLLFTKFFQKIKESFKALDKQPDLIRQNLQLLFTYSLPPILTSKDTIKVFLQRSLKCFQG